MIEWLLLASATLPAAATPLPAYNPASVTITRQARVHTGAVASYVRGCITLRSFGQVPGQQYAPIWPVGTTMRGQRILLPGGAGLPWGTKLGLRGRPVLPSDTVRATKACPGQPFLVEEAHRMFVWDDAAELVRMSDAVMVVRVNWVQSKDPLGDGMLTTIDATPVEMIKAAGIHVGRPLRLRLSSGIDAKGRWQNSVHDPIYGATGGLKRKLAGERWLLFVNQDLYAEQARVRDGSPQPGYLGGSIFYRLDGDRIVNESDSPVVETLAEVRAAARGRRR